MPGFVSRNLNYISLFAGIGGFDLALNRLGYECVWANEWDKYAAEIYKKQLGEVDTRDIRTVPTSDIPDHDLLVGGFPCQAFSIAGKRRGFDDTRGTLFFEIARILKDKNPKYFILENVKGLLSHDNGFTFKTIISTLDELGYDLQWQVLNSKNFGVPQNRERVFIVGHLRGQPRPKVFPITENNSEDIILPTVTSRVTADSNGTYVRKRQAYTFPTNTKLGYAEALEGDGINLAFPNSKTRRGRVIKGASPTLQANGAGSIGTLEKMRIRRLTPTECERLQGFPDGWTEGVSDTQRYKCLGNAVTVNVVYEVAKCLK